MKKLVAMMMVIVMILGAGCKAKPKEEMFKHNYLGYSFELPKGFEYEGKDRDQVRLTDKEKKRLAIIDITKGYNINEIDADKLKSGLVEPENMESGKFNLVKGLMKDSSDITYRGSTIINGERVLIIISSYSGGSDTPDMKHILHSFKKVN